MLQEKEARQAQSNLHDSDSVYGWISILLHWVTAIVIIVLWFAGKSIASASTDDSAAQRALHVSLAASAWLILLLRIIWRFRVGHPRVRGISSLMHRIAKSAHYVMLIVVLLMLVSGPFLVWSSGHPVGIFGWISIPGPIGESESLREIAWIVHSSSALLLFLLVLLHIGGALKHLMFHSDDIIARMIWPGRSESPETEQ